MTRPKPKGRNDGHQSDYSVIDKFIIVGSNLCKGNVCPIHATEFKKLNICVEINLDNERKEIPPEVDGYTWLPVIDGYPPSPIQFEIGASIIDKAVSRGKRVYVHCKNGHGRSPTLVAAYLILYQGMSPDEAEAHIKRKRSEIHIEANQKEALCRLFDTND